MAYIICDDHNLSVEADGMDPKTARQHMLNEAKANPSPIEKEVIEFGDDPGRETCSTYASMRSARTPTTARILSSSLILATFPLRFCSPRLTFLI